MPLDLAAPQPEPTPAAPAPITCPKCGMTALLFICSERGCPVNGGAAHSWTPPADTPAPPPAGRVELPEAVVQRAHQHYLHNAEFPCSASAMREAILLAASHHAVDLSALAPGAVAGVAADHVVVPREPTPEMLEPFARALCDARGLDAEAPCGPHGDVPTWFGQCGVCADAYTAMLAAAPEPPAPPRADAAEGSVPTDIALAVAFAIRRAIGRHVDRHGDIADQLDAACDDAMDAALKAMAGPSEGAPDRPGPAGREEVETLRAERDELADYAHKLQVALTNVAGGGSENFVGHGDGFRADIRFCVGKIQQRFTDSEERFRAQLRSCKAAEAELAALRSGRGAPGGGAAVPDDLRRLSEAAFSGSLRVGPHALDLLSDSPKGGDVKLFDVRGWGFYTGKGHGALGLSDDEGFARQDANAKFAAAAWNFVRARLADAPGRG